MPIFEYRCRECGAHFEKLQRSAAEAATCNNCQGHHLDRLLSVFAVSKSSADGFASETGPCACGAPRRGMCAE